MSKQVEKIKELIAKREQARLGGGEKLLRNSMHVEIHSPRTYRYVA